MRADSPVTSRRAPVLLPYPFPRARSTTPCRRAAILARRRRPGAARAAREGSASSGTAPSDDSVAATEAEAAGRPARHARRCGRRCASFVDWVAGYTLSPPGEVLAWRCAGAPGPRPARRPAGGAPIQRPSAAHRGAAARCWTRCRTGACARRGTWRAPPASAPASCGAWRTRGCWSRRAGHRSRRSHPRPEHPGRPWRPTRRPPPPRSAQRGRGAAGSPSPCSTASPARARPRSISRRSRLPAPGRQVLVLLPEIALTAQWLERFERRFGARPADWHSDLPPRRRAA